jgi:cobalt/nickel transport protein
MKQLRLTRPSGRHQSSMALQSRVCATPPRRAAPETARLWRARLRRCAYRALILRPKTLTHPPTAAVFDLGLLSSSACSAQSSWEGVDKTVVEKVAEQAGHPAREPYLNTDQGDLLLFLFLLAGAVGGFIAGYTFRSLFPPGKTDDQHHASAP